MVGIIKNHYRLIKKSEQIEQVDTLTPLLVGQANIIYLFQKSLYNGFKSKKV